MTIIGDEKEWGNPAERINDDAFRDFVENNADFIAGTTTLGSGPIKSLA